METRPTKLSLPGLIEKSRLKRSKPALRQTPEDGFRCCEKLFHSEKRSDRRGILMEKDLCLLCGKFEAISSFGARRRGIRGEKGGRRLRRIDSKSHQLQISPCPHLVPGGNEHAFKTRYGGSSVNCRGNIPRSLDSIAQCRRRGIG